MSGMADTSAPDNAIATLDGNAPNPVITVDATPIQPPQETEAQMRKRLIQQDFALGASSKHLRLPTGLARTDQKRPK
jgi:hypothetical protein